MGVAAPFKMTARMNPILTLRVEARRFQIRSVEIAIYMFGWIMMTNRSQNTAPQSQLGARDHDIQTGQGWPARAALSLLSASALIAVSFLATTASGQQENSPQRRAMADPFFQPPKVTDKATASPPTFDPPATFKPATFKPASQTGASKTINPRTQTPTLPAIEVQPKLFPKIEISPPVLPPLDDDFDIWDPPLTSVNIQPQPSSTSMVAPQSGFGFSPSTPPAPAANAGFAPMQFASQPPVPKSSLSDSIIREPLAAQAAPKSDSRPTGQLAGQTETPAISKSPFQLEAAVPMQGPKSSQSPANAQASFETSAETFELGRVLALVGGEPIFVGDVMFDINQVIEQYMPTAPESVKEMKRQEMIPQILPKMVDAKILFLGAIRSLPDEVDIEGVIEQAAAEFDNKARGKMMESAGIKSVAEFDAHLRGQGSSLRKLRRSWSTDQLTKYFLSRQLNLANEVTHQEMLDEYRKDIASYAIPAKCKWEQLMIRFDKVPSRSEAETMIAELGDRVRFGGNLAAVAKSSSHGFRAFAGGQHDWTTKGSLVLKEIDKAIFTLPIGELSNIIESDDGLHIVRVIDRTDATHTPFLEAQVEIKERIIDKKRDEAFKEHVKKLKSEIPVEYFVNKE